MLMQKTSYSYTTTLALPFVEAENVVMNALKKEQFGLISDIDIQAKLQEKLGIKHPRHKILGACNPKLAYQALQDNIDVALALPCNVVLLEKDGHTIVTALLPSVALQPFAGSKVREAGGMAEEALERVFIALSAGL